MSELAFGFTSFLQELDAIEQLANKLLDRQTLEAVLPRYRSQVESFRRTPITGTVSLVIPTDDPIRTKVSEGEYEPSSKGLSVFATISSVWDAVRVPPEPKSRPADEFRIVGKASTRVRIYLQEEDGETEWAMWRMEIGDKASPGCHFHVQVLGDSKEPPFPKLLPVPRLPSLVITPAAVLEFVLGELFQETWEKEMLRQENALNRWAPVQQDRMKRLLDWHSKFIENDPSPWMAMKKAKPDQDLFVRRGA